MARRVVRVQPSFFDALDALLPEHRTRDGLPSRTDFLQFDLSSILDALSDDYEGSTLRHPDASELRVLVTFSPLLGPVEIVVGLADDDGVEVFWPIFDPDYDWGVDGD